MELARNLHLRLQEMCDCYLETDFLLEMRRMSEMPVGDPEEDGLKYISLALLHAISEKAAKLTLKKKKGVLQITVENERKEALPLPPVVIFDRINEITRKILHLEENEGASPLVLGLRNGQVELSVRVKHEPEKDSLKFRFAGW